MVLSIFKHEKIHARITMIHTTHNAQYTSTNMHAVNLQDYQKCQDKLAEYIRPWNDENTWCEWLKRISFVSLTCASSRGEQYLNGTDFKSEGELLRRELLQCPGH